MRADVWAPFASTVTCRTGGVDAPLTAGEDGWWRGPQLGDGQDYAFLVDGDGPFPDPRSPWQPHGVHGPSRAFDAGAFAWTDADWEGRGALGSVFYELHVGTFTQEGTLDAAAAALPRLAEAGMEIVELMPIAPMPGARGWGYDGVSPFAVFEEYGGPAALQRCVDAAHGLGIATLLLEHFEACDVERVAAPRKSRGDALYVVTEHSYVEHLNPIQAPARHAMTLTTA